MPKPSTKTLETPSPFELLLPYQRRWVSDTSRFKIWNKARQAGGSLAAAFGVVDSILADGKDWVLISSGERQALELMKKVHQVADIFADAYQRATSKPFPLEKKAGSIIFPSGARIIAAPSNPNTARGYSANLLLDEFAFHSDPAAIWTAVFPIITNPLKGKLKLQIISTPFGLNNKFADIWFSADSKFSRHETSIYNAVEDGLSLNIDELRETLADSDAWAQEYECRFCESASLMFPYSLVSSAISSEANGQPEVIPERPMPRQGGSLFVGVDLGRKHDLTVCWTLERIPERGDTPAKLVTLEEIVLDRMPYDEQVPILESRLRYARHACVDSSGLGGPIHERLAKAFSHVEAVHFSQSTKLEIFSRTKRELEARALKLPIGSKVSDELQSLQRLVTSQGTVKIFARRTADGHADRATALALAVHASSRVPPAPLGYQIIFPDPLRFRRRRRFRQTKYSALTHR